MVERTSRSDALGGLPWLRRLRRRPALARLGAWIIFLAVVGHQQIAIRDEILDPAPYFNDNVLHLALARSAAEALDRGEDPTDFWFSPVTQGYPLFHHYQHLPHVVLAVLHRLTGGAVSIALLFRWSTLLLLALFPISVAWTVWMLGLGRTAAVFAGTAAALLSTNGLYGFDLMSYGWAGYGLTTQLWGSVLLGPAWALSRRAVLSGRGVVLAAAVTAALVLTHTVLGYVAILSSAVFPVVSGRTGLLRRVLRLAVLLGLAGALSSYFVVPFLLDRHAMNRSRWEDRSKYDAFGAEWTLGAFVKGELLDDSTFTGKDRAGDRAASRRLPVITILATAGLLVSLVWSRRRPVHRTLPLLFGMWFLLYFGRVTWGGVLDVLPFSGSLHFHRLIAPVHLAAAGLAGVGLAAFWNGMFRRRSPAFPIGAAVLTAVGLAFAVQERSTYYALRRGWCREGALEFARDRGALDRVLDRLESLPPGRVYSGRANNWGIDYRIGYAQVYSLVTDRLLDNVGYLYHALSLNAEIEGHMNESRPAHFNLFNVRYVVAPEGRTFPPFVEPLGQEGRHRYYRVKTTGYIDLVDVPLAFQGKGSGWYPVVQGWLAGRWVEAGQHPAFFLEEPVPEGFAAPVLPLDDASAGALDQGATTTATARPGRVMEKEARPGRYGAEIEAERSCFALLKATYHPGWKATVDGRPVATVMLAPAYVGVAVPRGTHEVAFAYDPGRLRSILFWAGLAVLLAGFGVEWRIIWKRGI